MPLKGVGAGKMGGGRGLENLQIRVTSLMNAPLPVREAQF